MHHIVEVASHGGGLRKELGHLVIAKEGRESRVPLDDIAALIISGGVKLTSEVLRALSTRGAPVILTDEAYLPASMMLPCFQHYRTQDVLSLQMGVSVPLQKKLWTRIVREKILNQRALLLHFSGPSRACDRLLHLAESLRSGDPDNKEAQAAVIYWPALFGETFFRRPEQPGLNALLNYTYAVLRASMARAIVAAGFHPSLGLFHRNRKNAFCLVDDLMEPFRALGDAMVMNLLGEGLEIPDLLPSVKTCLVKVLYIDHLTPSGRSPTFQCMRDLALSVVDSYRAKGDALRFPSWAFS